MCHQLKKSRSARLHELCPQNVRKSSPHKGLDFSPRSFQSNFPLLQGPGCKKSPSARFRSNRVKRDHDRGSYSCLTQLDRKSAGGDFLQLVSSRSGKLLWIDLGRKVQPILRRGRLISSIFWTKARAFSTDSKFDGIIITLIGPPKFLLSRKSRPVFLSARFFLV